MMRLFYNISGAVFRMILVSSLTVPFVPAMANMSIIDGSSTPDHQHCQSEPIKQAPVINGRSHGAASVEKDQHDCDRSCCPDGDCSDQDDCLNSALSYSLPMHAVQRITFPPSAGLETVYQARNDLINTCIYAPALRPPIG